MTYLEEIKIALKELEGMGSLKEINEIIEHNNTLEAIHTNPNWKDNIRATIQRHCNQTNSYRGAENLFYSVYGLGEGYWGLISYKKSQSLQSENPIIQRQISAINNDSTLTQTQKEVITTARIGQGLFRTNLISKYQHCLITGIKDSRLLIASHIKPWRDSDNRERISSENGLLLSMLYDKLFDIGLISFDNQMKLLISGELNSEDKVKIELDTNRVFIKNPSSELLSNMEYHRDVIFKH